MHAQHRAVGRGRIRRRGLQESCEENEDRRGHGKLTGALLWYDRPPTATGMGASNNHRISGGSQSTSDREQKTDTVRTMARSG